MVAILYLCLRIALTLIKHKFLINYVRLHGLRVGRDRTLMHTIDTTHHIGDQCLMRARLRSLMTAILLQ